jgi:hypothetical protein
LGTGAYADSEWGLNRVSGASPFAPGCNGDGGAGTLYPNSEVQPQLSVDPRNPKHLVGTYQQDRWSSVASQGVLTVTSFDGGKNWRRATPRVSQCGGGNAANGGDFQRATDSWTSVAPDGTAYLASLSMTGLFFEPGSSHAITVSRSGDGGLNWANPITLAGGGPEVFNDLPTVTADPADSRFVYVTWTKIQPLDDVNFIAPTYLARSTDGGRTWEAGRSIYDGGVNSQTVSNKIVVQPDGTLVNSYARVFEDSVTHAFKTETAVVRSTDRGVTWSAPIKVADIQAVGSTDPDVGTPIRTGVQFSQVAGDSRGNLYVTWQDSRFSNGQRDGIALSRSTDGGLTWSTPTAVNRDLSTQAFPAGIAVRRDGTVGVAYYDLRNNTPSQATLPADYWLASSRDGGATWSEQHVAGPFNLNVAPRVDRPVSSLYLGDYQGLVASGLGFVPFFAMTDTDQNRTDIFAGTVYPVG